MNSYEFMAYVCGAGLVAVAGFIVMFISYLRKEKNPGLIIACVCGIIGYSVVGMIIATLMKHLLTIS